MLRIVNTIAVSLIFVIAVAAAAQDQDREPASPRSKEFTTIAQDLKGVKGKLKKFDGKKIKPGKAELQEIADDLEKIGKEIAAIRKLLKKNDSKELRTQHNKEIARFNATVKTYNEHTKHYNAEMREFNAVVAEYNRLVAIWNKPGAK